MNLEDVTEFEIAFSEYNVDQEAVTEPYPKVPLPLTNVIPPPVAPLSRVRQGNLCKNPNCGCSTLKDEEPAFKGILPDYAYASIKAKAQAYTPAVIPQTQEKIQTENSVSEVLAGAMAGALRALSTGKYAGIQPRTTLQHAAALIRHLGRYLSDPQGVDGESGLPHLHHVLARAALLAFEHGRLDKAQ